MDRLRFWGRCVYRSCLGINYTMAKNGTYRTLSCRAVYGGISFPRIERVMVEATIHLHYCLACETRDCHLIMIDYCSNIDCTTNYIFTGQLLINLATLHTILTCCQVLHTHIYCWISSVVNLSNDIFLTALFYFLVQDIW